MTQPSYPPSYQPGYQPPAYDAYRAQMKPPTNILAIIGFIGVFFWSLVGIVLGHIALSQIKKTGESGHGLALAAVIIGYARLAFEALALVMVLMMFGIFGLAAASSVNSIAKDFGVPTKPDETYSANPWDGTEVESFCYALDDYELEMSDQKRFLEELLAETDDAEFAARIERQLDYLEADFGKMTNAEFSKYLDDMAEWPDAFDDQLDVCWSAGD